MQRKNEGNGYIVDFVTHKFSCLTCNGTGKTMKLEELDARLEPSEYSGALRLILGGSPMAIALGSIVICAA